jgi:membrane associated rhomboid family serine protease
MGKRQTTSGGYAYGTPPNDLEMKSTVSKSCRKSRRPFGCSRGLLLFVISLITWTFPRPACCFTLPQPPSCTRPITRPSLPRPLENFRQNWEGDDLRLSSRIRRRFRRFRATSDSQPARNTVLILNVLAYTFQTISSVIWIRRRHPSFWPKQAIPIVFDSLMGSSMPGLFTLDFVHSNAASRLQPHRLLSSGFLHGGILHLLVNMDTLRRLPAWLETGLGAPLYMTALLVSIVTGNLGHTFTTFGVLDKGMCLGSSGGICGLYGLMYVCMLKMGNSRAATSIIKGMGLLLLYGFVFENISNAAHVGGFLGGAVVGILCGPNYGKSYSLRRKWSLEADNSPRDYRVAMGFGTKPSSSGLVPLPVLWIAGLVALGVQARFRSIPKLIIQGLLRPGSLYALLN